MSILGLYPSILHTLRMGSQPPTPGSSPGLRMGDTGLASCWWEPDPKRECVRVRGRDRDRHADRGRHLSLGLTRQSPFLTVWSQSTLAPEAKALITLVAPLSSVWLPALRTMSSLRTPFPPEMFPWAQSLESTGLGVWYPQVLRTCFPSYEWR